MTLGLRQQNPIHNYCEPTIGTYKLVQFVGFQSSVKIRVMIYLVSRRKAFRLHAFYSYNPSSFLPSSFPPCNIELGFSIIFFTSTKKFTAFFPSIMRWS